MKRDNRFRIGLVIVLVIGSFWSLWPTARLAMMSPEARQEMQEILEEEERELWCMEGDPEIEDLLLEKHILTAHPEVVVNNLLNGEVLNDRDPQP